MSTLFYIPIPKIIIFSSYFLFYLLFLLVLSFILRLATWRHTASFEVKLTFNNYLQVCNWKKKMFIFGIIRGDISEHSLSSLKHSYPSFILLVNLKLLNFHWDLKFSDLLTKNLFETGFMVMWKLIWWNSMNSAG